MDRHKLEEKFFKYLMVISTLIIVISLLAVISVVLIKGIPALSISMITETPRGGYYLGGEGGILNAIIGSLYLAFGATILAIIISIPVAMFLQKEYSGDRFANFMRFSLDILWGVPSIVYGAFGFTIMLYLGIKASLMAGILVLTFLEIPIMTRAIDEVIRMVPDELKESSYSLGTTRFETNIGIIGRQVMPGIITGILLAFGRGIGDAASILFTAGFTDNVPTSLFDPVASLPLAIFFQLGTPFPEVQERAYAAAVILLFIVLFVSITSRILTDRFARYSVK